MKKMNKTLAIAIAAAMVSPSAFAAQDTSGMQFTSASEGFYASIRARLDLSTGDDESASIDDNSSRLGVRGSNDLGGGLSGFYQWEAELKLNDNEGPGIDRSRLGHVGLRGSFGEFVVGGFWTNEYNWTHGGTDIANNYSGWLTYSEEHESRSNNGIQYTTPDLNGFQAAVLVQTGSKNSTVMGSTTAGAAGNSIRTGRSDNDIDTWNIAAKYDIQGFSVGASYNNQPDYLSVIDNLAVETPTGGGDDALTYDNTGYDDSTSWTIKSGYAQDNWYVNAWYGEDNTSDRHADFDDTEFFSIAGGVSVDKVNLYILHEQRERPAIDISSGSVVTLTHDDAYTTLGVQYTLGSQSRVWVEYWGRELDSNPEAEDRVSIGLRHDF